MYTKLPEIFCLGGGGGGEGGSSLVMDSLHQRYNICVGIKFKFRIKYKKQNTILTVPT